LASLSPHVMGLELWISGLWNSPRVILWASPLSPAMGMKTWAVTCIWTTTVPFSLRSTSNLFSCPWSLSPRHIDTHSCFLDLVGLPFDNPQVCGFKPIPDHGHLAFSDSIGFLAPFGFSWVKASIGEDRGSVFGTSPKNDRENSISKVSSLSGELWAGRDALVRVDGSFSE